MNKKVFLVVMAGLLRSRGLLAEEQPKSFIGEEMVVSAMKTENKRRDIPNSVIVIDETSIKASSAQHLGELLANRVGIDLNTYGNYGGAPQEIQIRGMNADGTQVFVNGVSVNSLSLGRADVAKIPLANIEKIEIVKGAGSMLYGSGASGGVINIFTKNPDKGAMNFALMSEYGTQGTYGISLAQGKAITENSTYYLTLGQNGTEGFRNNSDLHGKDASLNLTYQKSAKLKISLYGDYNNREFGMPGVKPPAGTAGYYIAGQEYYNNEAASLLNRHEDTDSHVVLHVNGKLSEQLLYSFQSDYSSSTSYNYDRETYSPSSNKTWITNKVKGFEGNTTLKPFGGAEILLGGEYKQYDNENRQIGMDSVGNELPSTRQDYLHDLHSSAVYAEAQYRPLRLIKFQSGVRQEENSIFGVKNVYRYGVVVNPTETTTLKFNRGSHFKAPTMNDLFWPDDGSVKGNPMLSPETGLHTDLTLEQELGKRIFVTASYFNWNVKNKIAWAEDPSQPAVYGGNYWVPTNLDSYKADGMELGASIGPFSNVSLSLDYNLLYAVEEKVGAQSRQVMYTPRQHFKGQLTYSDKSGVTVSPSLTYVDRRPYYAGSNGSSVPTQFIASYWLVDMKISKRINDNVLLSVSGNNLLDADYVTRLATFYDASFSSTLSPFPAAGRSLLFSITYNY
jgi:outer membrane cobalamin receptor